MKPNAIHYLSLARKAGRIEVGEEPTGAAARSGHARLILVASDAPDNTRRRAKNFVAGTDQQMVVLPFTKEEMGSALGRTVVALAAMTDPAMALAFLKSLEDEKRYGAAIEALTIKTDRFRRHQQEEKAHQRNLRMGKIRKEPKKEAPKAAPPTEGEAPYREERKPGFDREKKAGSFGRAYDKKGGKPQKDRPLGNKEGKRPFPGKNNKGTKEYRPEGSARKPYGGGKGSPARQGYATGNKVAGRKPGRKTHGGAEE